MAVFAAAFLTFQRNFTTPEESHMVPVDLVTIAAKTNIAAQAPPDAKPPEPQKLDIPTPPAPEIPEPQMQDVEPAPEPPMPKFDVAKPPKLEVEQAVVEKPVDKPVEKPQPTKKQQSQDFNDILNKLTAPDKSTAKKVKPGPRVVQGVGLGSAMTASLVDALRSQIIRCYSLQISPPNPADAIVDYDVHLTRDGRVASAELLTRGHSPYTQAAAEAASRALYSCQPYRLPPESYDAWSEINPLHFDPREMLQ